MSCPHPGYLIKDGELRCVKCGEPSPRARLVNNQIVPIKAGEKPENKMQAKPEDKGVHWPAESKRIKAKVR